MIAISLQAKQFVDRKAKYGSELYARFLLSVAIAIIDCIQLRREHKYFKHWRFHYRLVRDVALLTEKHSWDAEMVKSDLQKLFDLASKPYLP